MRRVAIGLLLDLDQGKHPFVHHLESFGEGGHSFAAEGRPEPAARVQALQIVQAVFSNRPGAVRAAIDIGVVHHDQPVASGQADVELDAVCTCINGIAEGQQGIFRRGARCAAMPDHGNWA